MVRVDADEYPLLVMGALMTAGGLALVVRAAGTATLPFDPLLAAYALFVAAFLVGVGHTLREENPPGAAGYGVGAIGWIAGAAGYVTARPTLVAFSLAALVASGTALAYLGVEKTGLLER